MSETGSPTQGLIDAADVVEAPAVGRAVLGPSEVLDTGRGPSTDPGLAWECALQLAFEARLLDERRFEEWLSLWAEDCLYWVPTSAERNPGVQMAVAYEDRRRLEDRVAWLRSKALHAQRPLSRTVRQITNVEAWAEPWGRLIRSTCTLHEQRAEESREWRATVEHRLIPHGDDWKIARKTVLLIDFDQPLRNIALIF